MNKLQVILILTLINWGNTFSQNLSDSLVTYFFDQTLGDYFGKNYGSETDFYILSDSLLLSIKTDYENFRLHLIEEDQTHPLIRKKEIYELYWVRLDEVASDTVDINIGAWDVEFKLFSRKRSKNGRKWAFATYYFASWCGGTEGYLPEGRFIFNEEKNIWEFYSEEDALNQRLNRLSNH